MYPMRILLLVVTSCSMTSLANLAVNPNQLLHDSTALVGQLFTYVIPRDAFVGTVHTYAVSQADNEPLPQWLMFDVREMSVYGVPDEEDVGPLFLKVKAEQRNATHSVEAEDVFALTVKEFIPNAARKLKSYLGKEDSSLKCSKSEPIISIGILFDIDMMRLDAMRRRHALTQISGLFSVPLERLRIYKYDYVKSQSLRPLRGGQGEISAKTAYIPTYINILEACGAQIPHESEKLISQVEEEATSGRLSAQVGYRVLSWEVNSGVFMPKKNRRNSASTPNQYTQPDYPTPTTTVTETTTSPPTTRITTRIPTTTTEEPTTFGETTYSTSSPTRTTPMQTRMPGDTKPHVLNSMVRITCYKGILCHHRIPEDTFVDLEDGSTYDLKLSLSVLDSPGDSAQKNWVHLDKHRRHLLGITMMAGRWHFALIGEDKSGQIASTAFYIEVIEQENPEQTPSHSFQVTLESPEYNEFVNNATQQVHFIRKLSRYLKDGSNLGSSNIEIREISEGSTVISWSNNSISTQFCNKAALNKLLRRMKTKDGNVKNSFKDKMAPEFVVSKIEMNLEGICLVKEKNEGSESDESEPVIKSPGRIGPSGTGDFKSNGLKNQEVQTGSVAKVDDFWVSTIIPIIIIVVLLLVALIIACILYRKNKKAKAAGLRGPVGKEAKNEFVSKGAPIIFPDEVDPLTKEPTATTPMLIKEERPPIGADETEMQERPYFGGSNGVGGHTTHENPLYKPPAPLELTSAKSPRPRHSLPNQRQPPPYVPP